MIITSAPSPPFLSQPSSTDETEGTGCEKLPLGSASWAHWRGLLHSACVTGETQTHYSHLLRELSKGISGSPINEHSGLACCAEKGLVNVGCWS